MSKVFVLNSNKKSVNPIHPAKARQLLRDKKAAIFRQFPFTIILKEEKVEEVDPLRLKIDPGAKTTGLAIINDKTGEVVFAAEITHRGFQIREALTNRRQLRRFRRNRKTRYRQPRFLNRTKPKGWLPPSLESRIANILTWVNKLKKYSNIQAISQELVKFDTQLMQNKDIQGKEYQQGTLAGYETREYLLEKWNRKCVYCDAKDLPLQIEHIHPKSKGGSNSISNLTLACEKCNIKKGTKDIKEFLKGDLIRLEKIINQSKRSLADSAAVNTTKWKLFEKLKETNLPIETGSGGLTKYNRTQQNLNKEHWIDACCVGKSTPILKIKGIKPLQIIANGHGTRQMCRTDKYGFPNRHCSRTKIHFGFQTGDIVKAIVTKGKKIGKYIGRIAIRATGSFNLNTRKELVQGVSYKYCKIIHKKDGYSYVQK